MQIVFPRLIREIEAIELMTTENILIVVLEQLPSFA